MIGRLLLTFSLAVSGGWAMAEGLVVPERAQLSAEAPTELTEVSLPAGPWADGALPVVSVSGAMTRRAYQFRDGRFTTAQLMAPLRDQLVAQGYDIVFECSTQGCGGFDFRFALDLLPDPAMYVNLGDFRYLLARKDGEGGVSAISIVSSTSARAGHVHITEVIPAVLSVPPAEPSLTETDPAPETTGLEGRLLETGRAVLEGLEFRSGSAELSDTAYQGFDDLLRFLSENPEARIAIVGHTDAVGSLDQNIALSRRRAEAVRDVLTGEYGAAPGRITADGVGFLAPRAPNATPEGRARNRRVEVILLTPG